MLYSFFFMGVLLWRTGFVLNGGLKGIVLYGYLTGLKDNLIVIIKF